MRSRVGAGILLTVGFIAAAVSYNAWIASRTVLDPGTTPALARALLDTHTVQQHLEDQLTTQVGHELALRHTDPRVAAAVREAVRDPRVVGAFATAVSETHAALLGDASATITLNGQALTRAVYDALAPSAPELAARLAQQPPVEVQLDGSQLPHLGHARQLARTLMGLGAIAALALIGASLLLVRDRRAVGRLGRRIAYLAITPLFVFLLLPRVASGLLGDDSEPVRAALRVYGSRVMPSAIALVVIGVAVALGARLVPGAAPTPEPPADRPVPPSPAAEPVEPRIKERLYL